MVLSGLWVVVEAAEISAASIREVAWLLAALPPAVFVPLVLWLDRYEAEPRWLLGGAGLAVSAPVVEELSKGAALWLLVRYRREELDGVLDGLVYATMVALGFAMTENVLYYGRAALGLLEGSSLGAVFGARGIVTPLASPGVPRVLQLVPGLGTLLAFVASLWMLASMLVAVRRALDFQSTGRAVVVCLVGFVCYVAVWFLAAMALGVLLGLGAAVAR